MPSNPSPPTSLRFNATASTVGPSLPLPTMLLQPTARSGTSEIDPLLAGIQVEETYSLAGPGRGEPAPTPQTLDTGRQQLLAVEAEDGSTLFIRADALAEAVARLRPEAVANGEVDFAQFRDENAASRGVGEVLWKAVSVLKLPSDGLLQEAGELAKQWARKKLGKEIEAKAYEMGSFLGAKALMWKIESRLAGRPGLYHWHARMLSPADYCPVGNPRLKAIGEGKPALVLIHGTGSYTLGAFADLREDEASWAALNRRFPGGIFGYEHRTFSESPIENALALLEVLPKGARVSLLTHSRGGLVGDLLCLGEVDDKMIAAYRIDTREAADVDGLEREAEEERERLRQLRALLKSRAIMVERYVRVACPARGTRLLSENLDAALSDFLKVMQIGGSALAGVVAASLGGPVAGETVGRGASSCLGVVKRLVLEIAARRIDPRYVPGIAAMRTDSPLSAFLSRPGMRRRDGIDMAVVAGDTEFDSLGLSNFRRRIANLFCDWKLFDQNDNDLVVDTDSMYAGLGFSDNTHYLYDRDESVTHFRYFRNPLTRGAIGNWLTEADIRRLTHFQPLGKGRVIPWQERDARLIQRGGEAGPRPVVILIPGIMGSHIKIKRANAKFGQFNRVWFDLDSLALGQLELISDPDQADIQADDLFEMFYGDLAEHLAASHTVVRCPYDWRRPLAKCAEELKAKIEQAAHDQPGQPIRLLAHSMGGLVARALMRYHPEAWNTVVQSDGRLLMLGTPNNGSHLMVHSLLGKSGSMRKLEAIDLKHNLQQLLQIVAGFPGALALLPRPGFQDTGNEARIGADEYFQQQTWQHLREKNTDRWYGDGICGVPAQTLLEATQATWNDLPNGVPAHAERVGYVFGQSDKTPCGVTRDSDGRLKLLFTADGDGSVTWASGQLGNLDLDTQCWYMPVEHGDLTGTDEYFPAIAELLQTGATRKLDRLPRRRGEETRSFVLEAEPPVMPSEEELARALLGSGPRLGKPSRARQTLKVAVRAGDLRFLDQPVMCGHYIGDAISGAEAALDALLDGALSERERLGLYAAEMGSSAIVLRPPTEEERLRGSLPGAIIVGLGQFTGQLSARQVTETVRSGVLRYLLQLRDAIRIPSGYQVQLYSLLIGWNSTARISVAESVTAITRGVLEANRQFRDAMLSGDHGAAVAELHFIELYRDAAISAARAVLDLPLQLATELKRLGAHVEPATSVTMGEGVMERLSAADDLGHWSRLIITDADASEVYCPPECYEVRSKSPIPAPLMQSLCRDEAAGEAMTKDKTADASPAESRYYPERLKYVFLSTRARAETVWQHRQSGLIEAIIREQRRNPSHDPRLGHTLFQLMVPLDYKVDAREQSRLLLVLDSYTANLPWELLQADSEPLVIKTPMVRQLSTARYRRAIRTANINSACIIVAPSTYGFDQRFPGDKKELDKLPGSIDEGMAISDSLRKAGWTDITSPPPDKEALDIFNVLYERPYRVLMIGAHGVFEAKAKDGRSYSGIVLSDGLLLTAAEISQMEVVPELVFLNCCHLGSISNPYSEPNRLAYSVSRELIEMGVRCVVAAGWAVNDAAACTFASAFFDELTRGATFGQAVFEARNATYRKHPGSNTWGAYQAYGDPGYRLQAKPAGEGSGGKRPYVAVDELLARLDSQRSWNKGTLGGETPARYAEQSQWVRRQLAKCPPEWADRPDVLQAIGSLYADLGSEGFAAARTLWQRALQLEDEGGRVAVKTIEQLANVEARHAAILAEQGDLQQATALLDRSIRRMRTLRDSVQGESKSETNAERAAILGSALKLKALVQAKAAKPWAEIARTLNEAANAYREAVPADPALRPYLALNWLPLAWLCDGLDMQDAEAAGLALRCGEAARNQFAASKDFWDAVMSVDAEMTARLIHKSLKEPAAEGLAATLDSRYQQAVHGLPQSERQWDSVVRQWRLLAELLKARQHEQDDELAQALITLADRFLPRCDPAAAKPTPTSSAEKKTAEKKTAERKTAQKKTAENKTKRKRRTK